MWGPPRTLTPALPLGTTAHIGLAVDETHVYWGYAQHLWRVPREGGVAETIATSEGSGQSGMPLAVDAQHVYWAAAHTRLTRARKDGSDPVLLADEPLGMGRVALDEAWVFWTSGAARSVAAVPKAGGERQLQAFVFERWPLHIAVDATHVYWSNTSGPLSRTPKGGGESVVIAEVRDTSQLIVDGDAIYWTEQGDVFRPTGRVVKLAR